MTKTMIVRKGGLVAIAMMLIAFGAKVFMEASNPEHALYGITAVALGVALILLREVTKAWDKE